MKIRNKKSEYKPIRVVGKNKYIISWDFQPLYKNGKETNLGIWEEYCFYHKPDISEIRTLINNYYNSIVDENILKGYKWNGFDIWLSSENQFNYKAAYDIAVQTNGSNLPIKFKFGNNDTPQYYVFNDLEDLKSFYMGAIEHIQNELNQGWNKKDAIKWQEYENK